MGKKVTTKLRFKNVGDLDIVKNCAAYINMDLSNYATRAVYEFTKAVLEQRKQQGAASKVKAEADVSDKGASSAKQSPSADVAGTTEGVPAGEDAASPALADAETAPVEVAAQS